MFKLRQKKKGENYRKRNSPVVRGVGGGGQWKEENRRGAKAGTTPQCFLSLAPRSRNIIVNISPELLAPIQTSASACSGWGCVGGGGVGD